MALVVAPGCETADGPYLSPTPEHDPARFQEAIHAEADMKAKTHEAETKLLKRTRLKNMPMLQP
ncbi:MAG: hypothetical protein ABS79_03175 [Planctomycetes bacterium SCN 63-9]|nr:MAG: hypothetical protein ABS79_03175 [Planctomycetes bacterium SCN 63-9]